MGCHNIHIWLINKYNTVYIYTVYIYTYIHASTECRCLMPDYPTDLSWWLHGGTRKFSQRPEEKKTVMYGLYGCGSKWKT